MTIKATVTRAACLATLILCRSTASAQLTREWAHSFGVGISPVAVVPDTSGATDPPALFAIGVFVDQYQASSYVTSKYSASGVRLWTRYLIYPDTGKAVPTAAAVDQSGNVIVTGTAVTGVGADPNVITVKYDGLTGRTLWTQKIAGAAPGALASIAIDSTNDVFVTAPIRVAAPIPSGFETHTATAQYQPDGTVAWTADFLSPHDVYAYPAGIVVDPTGAQVTVTAAVTPEIGGSSAVTIRYDGNGNVVWTSRWLGTAGGDASPLGVQTDADGNVLVVGNMPQPDHYNWGRESFALKYDALGRLLWSRKEPHSASGFSLTHAGGIVMVGGDGNNNAQTTLLGSKGQILWRRGRTAASGQAVGVDSEDGIYVLANVLSATSGIELLRYNASGMLVSHAGRTTASDDGYWVTAPLAVIPEATDIQVIVVASASNELLTTAFGAPY